MRTVDELARASETGAGARGAPGGRPRSRGVRVRELRRADAAQLHLAHPLQRRRGAQVDRIVRSRHPGRLRHARGPADRLRQRAERPVDRGRRARAGEGAPGGGRRSRVRLAARAHRRGAHARRLPRSAAHGARRHGPRRGGLEDHRRRPPNVRRLGPLGRARAGRRRAAATRPHPRRRRHHPEGADGHRDDHDAAAPRPTRPP